MESNFREFTNQEEYLKWLDRLAPALPVRGHRWVQKYTDEEIVNGVINGNEYIKQQCQWEVSRRMAWSKWTLPPPKMIKIEYWGRRWPYKTGYAECVEVQF